MKKHFVLLDFLRGFAALSVVLFHFSYGVLPTLEGNYLKEILYYGAFGVQVFFVISGFIIPYSMYKSNYTIAGFFQNIKRRFVRICPPSYIAILLVFILYFSAILINSKPIDGMEWPGVNLTAIIGNLTYTVPYLNTSWYNPVFWTLAIEFQFYIIIGALLPVFLLRKNALTVCLILAILLLGCINFEWFFKYSGFFVLGILLFFRQEKIIADKYIYALIPITLIACFFQSSLAPFLFGVGAFVLMFFNFNLNFKATNFLGKISYSLYITHLTIGVMAEIIVKRVTYFHEYPLGKTAMIFVYAGITILFSYLFYKWFEKPFIKLSKKIKYQ